MKLHLASPSGNNLFTGYGAGYVMVNQRRYQQSLVVMPQHLIETWAAADFDQLNAGHFAYLLGLRPEIVLLGTGGTLRFPPPATTRCLAESSIGLEVMDTRAACRTYNILTAEGRNTAAAILLA